MTPENNRNEGARTNQHLLGNIYLAARASHLAAAYVRSANASDTENLVESLAPSAELLQIFAELCERLGVAITDDELDLHLHGADVEMVGLFEKLYGRRPTAEERKAVLTGPGFPDPSPSNV
jgi:hypothetical protein